MLSYEAQLGINQPADRVFTFLARFHENYAWVGSVLAVEKLTPGPVSAGTRFLETVKFGLLENQVTWEVAVYEPPERLVYRGDTFLGRSEVLFACTSLDGHTRLRVRTSGVLRGPYRLLGPLLRFLGLRERKKHLSRIKEELENG